MSSCPRLAPARATPPTDAEAAARAALRNAIAVLPALEAAAHEAARRVGRATGMVDAAQAALARFDDLDERMKAHHSAALSAHTNPALPPPLIEARRQRTEAREHVGAVAELHADVAREAAAGVAAVAAAAARVQACTLAVMRELAQQEGVRMREAEAEAGRLRARVLAYSDSLGLGDRVSGSLPPSLAMMLHDPWHAALLEVGNTDPAADRAAWAELRQRLARDPDAPGAGSLAP